MKLAFPYRLALLSLLLLAAPLWALSPPEASSPLPEERLSRSGFESSESPVLQEIAEPNVPVFQNGFDPTATPALPESAPEWSTLSEAEVQKAAQTVPSEVSAQALGELARRDLRFPVGWQSRWLLDNAARLWLATAVFVHDEETGMFRPLRTGCVAEGREVEWCHE